MCDAQRVSLLLLKVLQLEPVVLKGVRLCVSFCRYKPVLFPKTVGREVARKPRDKDVVFV
jgi:hypothetical protein